MKRRRYRRGRSAWPRRRSGCRRGYRSGRPRSISARCLPPKYVETVILLHPLDPFSRYFSTCRGKEGGAAKWQSRRRHGHRRELHATRAVVALAAEEAEPRKRRLPAVWIRSRIRVPGAAPEIVGHGEGCRIVDDRQLRVHAVIGRVGRASPARQWVVAERPLGDPRRACEICNVVRPHVRELVGVADPAVAEAVATISVGVTGVAVRRGGGGHGSARAEGRRPVDGVDLGSGDMNEKGVEEKDCVGRAEHDDYAWSSD